MAAAATDLQTIGSTLEDAHARAAPMTTAVAPAAADEVSATIAHLFSQHAQGYQAVARQAATLQEQFVQNLKAGAAAYTSIEDAIVGLLRGLETGIAAIPIAYEQLVVNFLTAAGSWSDLIPAPLQPFVVGIPFLSIFIVPIPFLFAIVAINALIDAITGIPS